MTSYLFILDFERLDNGMFLKELAKTIALYRIPSSIFIHGDSEYTNRIIQLGTLREDAQIRATKELNHRLTALFADEGIALSSFNGYQRNIISMQNSQIDIDSDFLLRQLKVTHLLLSNLITNNGKTKPLSLQQMSLELMTNLNIEKAFVFSKSSGNVIKQADYQKPDEFKDTSHVTAIDVVDLGNL